MPSPIRHRFIAIDEGLGALLHIDERDPAAQWLVPIGQPQARDMQLVGHHRLLISHHHGFAEFDIRTGQKLSDFTALEGVTAARRQPDGATLVAGVNLAGETGVTLLTLSPAPENKILRRATYGGDYVRLIRQTTPDTCLFMCDSRVRLANTTGAYLADYPVSGFQHTWKALRLPDGRILASAGYGAFMAELDPAGKLLRTFGSRDQVPPEVSPFFYAMFQLLPNGNIVVANWQGHGPDNGNKGVQLLEFTPAGRLVWQWRQPPALVSSLQGLIILDDLDTARLHDERSGVMAPL